MATPNTSASEALVHPSWDVGSSVFKTFDLLSALTKSLSQDNVHPETVLAAEAIGAGLLIAPERIREGIEALNGHENYRLLQTRITIGLHHGNTQRALRRSTPLLQFYVFVSAFKLIFLNEEIADILFEMLSATGLYNKHPVSPAMFRQLLDQIGGHTESLAPMHLMHEMASKISGFDPPEEVYHRIEPESVAKIFTALFETIRNDDIKHIRISGCLNGVWIATVIAWWLPKDFALSYGENILLDKSESKVEIVIGTNRYRPWTIETWSKIANSDRLFFYEPDDNPTSIGRIPLKLMANIYGTRFWERSTVLDNRQRSTELQRDLTTQVASSLISTMLKYGSLKRTKEYCDNKGEWCSQVNISSIVNDSWLKSLPKVLESYGLGEYRVNEVFTDYVDYRFKQMKPDQGFTEEVIENASGKLIQSALGAGRWPTYRERIEIPAFAIALDAILSCTTQVNNATRYASDNLIFTRLSHIRELIGSLVRGNMELRKFRHYAMECLLPGYKESSSILAVAQGGIVVSMTMLRGVSSGQRDSIGLVYSKGTIKKDDIQFNYITDSRSSADHKEQWRFLPQVYDISMKAMAYDGIPPRDERKPVSFDLETQVSVRQDTLNLRQFLVVRTNPPHPERKLRVSWLDAAYTIATAYHIDLDSVVSLTQSSYKDNVRVVLSRDARWAQIYGVKFESDATGRCAIIDTAGNEFAKFFCAARYGCGEGNRFCHRIFIYHNGSLKSFIEESAKWPSSILIT